MSAVPAMGVVVWRSSVVAELLPPLDEALAELPAALASGGRRLACELRELDERAASMVPRAEKAGANALTKVLPRAIAAAHAANAPHITAMTMSRVARGNLPATPMNAKIFRLLLESAEEEVNADLARHAVGPLNHARFVIDRWATAIEACVASEDAKAAAREAVQSVLAADLGAAFPRVGFTGDDIQRSEGVSP